jgi:hypothetical protein
MDLTVARVLEKVHMNKQGRSVTRRRVALLELLDRLPFVGAQAELKHGVATEIVRLVRGHHGTR